MAETWLAVLLLGLLLLFLFVGVPIAISMAISSMVIIVLVQGWRGVGGIPIFIFTSLSEFVMIAVPLFILMGQVILVSGMGRDLYSMGAHLFKPFPGGLAMGSVGACAIFGAMCGVSVAGAATVGTVAIPEMRRYGYSDSLATGTVAAAGALATLIPPSVQMILYGIVANVSIGQMFISGIIPGILLTIFMMVYIGIAVKLRPAIAPPISLKSSGRDKVRAIVKVWPALLLITAVMGTIYSGLFTATEAAASGALVAFIISGLIYRSLTCNALKEILAGTIRTSSMILIILAFALIFGRTMTLLGAPQAITTLITTYGLGKWTVLIAIMILYIIAGMFIDASSIIVITIPLLVPTLLFLNVDLIWFGLVTVVNMEMSVITPPVGLNLYVIKGFTPDVEMRDIIWGALPFVFVECVVLALVLIFPELALWLPSMMK